MANHIRKQALSMRGAPVDFSSLSQTNAQQRALGNAGMNANGDLVGSGGVVLKTQEQIEAEWAARRQTTTTTASIKSDTIIPRASTSLAGEATVSPSDTTFPSISDLVASGTIVPTPAQKTAGSNE